MKEYNKMTTKKMIDIWTPVLCRKANLNKKYAEFIEGLLYLQSLSINTLASHASMPSLTLLNNCDKNLEEHKKIQKNSSALFRYSKSSKNLSVYDNLEI